MYIQDARNEASYKKRKLLHNIRICMLHKYLRCRVHWHLCQTGGPSLAIIRALSNRRLTKIPPTQVQAKKDQHSRYHQYRTQEAEIRTNLTGRATFDGENCKCRNPCPFPTVLPHNPNRFLVPKSKTMTISEF